MHDDLLNLYAARLAKESSIRTLINKSLFSPTSFSSDPQEKQQQRSEQQPFQFSNLIRGGKTESLGGMFQAQGLNAVPSPEFKAPCQECIYFFGGYTIQYHGSRDPRDSDLVTNGTTISNIGTMDAIQLELPKILRLVEKDQGREVGMKLGRAVVEFASRYYGLFRETASVVAREQPDAVVMGAMAKGMLSSRSGASTPRQGGTSANGGRGGGDSSGSGASGGGGGASSQLAHSSRLQERLARVYYAHNRAQQRQPQQQQQVVSGASLFPHMASPSGPTSIPSDGWDNQSGDSNQSSDSEVENESKVVRRLEVKRQTSRL